MASLKLCAAALAAAMFAGVSNSADADCSRDCLKGMVDRYLEAMIAHDPKRAPFAPTIKFTENTSILPLQEGLWATATGTEAYRIYVPDTQAGQVGFIGVVREHGRKVILTLRLKVVDQKITEAESVVARSIRNFARLETPRAGIVQILQPGERVPREQLVKAVNLYFDGIEQSNGAIVPFDKQCDRLENGIKTTNNPDLAGEMGGPGSDPNSAPQAPKPAQPKPAAPAATKSPADNTNFGGRTCRDGFDSGVFQYISRISPREGIVVDEETGNVFGFFMFQHRGLPLKIKLKNGTEVDAPFNGVPWNMQMGELFKIRSGNIWLVEAIGSSLPFGARTGWE